MTIKVFQESQESQVSRDSEMQFEKVIGQYLTSDLIIPGQTQTFQEGILRSRPDILVTTPSLMTDFVLRQHDLLEYDWKIFILDPPPAFQNENFGKKKQKKNTRKTKKQKNTKTPKHKKIQRTQKYKKSTQKK